MSRKKLGQLVLASTMVLSIGVSAAMVVTEEVSAATVVSQTAYETIMTFSAKDLSDVTGLSLTTVNVQKMYAKMKKTGTWESLGYKGAQAKKVSQRVSASSNQTQGILKTMAKTAGTELKVVYIHNGYYEGVNLGSVTAKPVLPEKPEKPTKPSKPSSGLGSNIKEIDIEFDYKKRGQDIDLDISVRNDGRVQAKYQNQNTNQKLEGDSAEAIAVDLLSGLDLKTMSQEQIADHVTAKLEADKNFKKFAFKVKYFDGSKVAFKIK